MNFFSAAYTVQLPMKQEDEQIIAISEMHLLVPYYITAKEVITSFIIEIPNKKHLKVDLNL